MNYTENYKLPQFEAEDPVNREDFNAALRVIDAELAGTVPLTKGGTGKTTAAAALYALINGVAALSSTGLATGDCIPIGDVSAATGKKVTLANLASYLQASQSMAKIQAGSYVGTGTYGADNPCSLTFDFVPQMLCMFGADGIPLSFSRYQIDYLRFGSTSVLTTTYQQDVFFKYTSSDPIGRLYARKSSNGKTIEWYALVQNTDANQTVQPLSSAEAQMNSNGTTYRYIAIG